MKKLIAVVAVVLLSASCATKHGGPRSPGAHPPHSVIVSVHNNAIEVNVEELKVRGTDQVIFWDLVNADGQNYAFPGDGIAFATEEGRRQFDCRKLNDKRFRCLDRGTVKGRFKYDVKLSGTPAVSPLDPFVLNH